MAYSLSYFYIDFKSIQMKGFFNKSRVIYLFTIISVIVLGLISRKISFVPLFVGDILWATMIFFMIKFLIGNKGISPVALISILICFLVEISQLYQTEWINAIRHTLPGRLILGQGFLWSDLVAYTGGIALGVMLDIYVITPLIISNKQAKV
jgi:hypothetical protein